MALSTSPFSTVRSIHLGRLGKSSTSKASVSRAIIRCSTDLSHAFLGRVDNKKMTHLRDGWEVDCDIYRQFEIEHSGVAVAIARSRSPSAEAVMDK